MKCIRMMSVCGATCEVQIRIIRARSSMGVVAMRESNRIESNRIESNRSNHAPPGPSRPSSARAAAYSCVSNSLKDSVSAGFRRTPG